MPDWILEPTRSDVPSFVSGLGLMLDDAGGRGRSSG
jgi:hypothetical protein